MLALIEVAKAKKLAAQGSEADVLEGQDAYVEAQIGLLKAGGKLEEGREITCCLLKSVLRGHGGRCPKSVGSAGGFMNNASPDPNSTRV